MPPDDKPISNFTIRSVLTTLKEVSPRDYADLLRDSGLQRLEHMPLGDRDPATVRSEELAQLFATVHRVMGETLTRVFLTNYGHKLAPLLLQHPEMVALVARGPEIPAATRLGWAAREMVGFLSRVWTSVSLREEEHAYQLEVAHCPVCEAIRGTRQPLCASSEVIYTALARALTGKRVTLIESTCRAQGARCCAYRLLKA